MTLIAGLGALIGGAGCGEAIRTGRAPVLLVVDRLEAASGAEPSAFSGVLHSDVETVVERTAADGVQTPTPLVLADPGLAELRLVSKDASAHAGAASPSEVNAVTIRRYRVAFRRTDGRSAPGIDVPYGFEGAVTVTVAGTGPADVALDVVRMQAKLEPPLRNLRGGGGVVALSVVADVTFYGRDLAGNEVQTTGSISIVFADWPDPR